MKAEMKHFEDFMASADRDIFQKVHDLYAEVNTDRELQPYVDALGVQTLSGAKNHSLLKERNGEIHDVIMLGSNSYFSLTTHPDVVSAAKSACDQYGYGMGAVSLYAGKSDLHYQLEKKIANFYGTEDAILLPSGYATNVGVISALCGPGDVIINDAFNHASIFDGCRLSGAEIKVYLHGNMKHLEKILRQLSGSSKGRLIVTDGVFSMDGDLAPLDKITELAARYGARVMVDDAHGLGVVGPSGRGTAEQFGVMEKIDIQVGMLSKAPGALGGYCAGSSALITYLRYYARTYFFSTSLPAPIVAGLLEVFKLFSEDRAGRGRLWENIRRLLEGLQALGFNCGQSQSAIIPVFVNDEMKLTRLCNELRQNGIYTNLVSYPAVRRKECRLRLCVTSALTEDDINKILTVFEELGRKYELI
ncbi:MAG: aminotransferase class I/II-fold pyridoxal phosphate-dependent enzyme [Desulfobacteraceae bacterium]|nr:MAG: aminotransferase class I/II-fold pyridoxal phosphate-dependent enzyme [Desulfobacteraceae bacterium]